jgi:organic hydroperoxide reductase OsmC/OhrA
MAQFSRNVTVDWTGSLMEGTGQAKAGSGAFSLPVTFPRRIGAAEGGTSPEELIAGAHAACYAMVVAATMGKKGATVKKHTVTSRPTRPTPASRSRHRGSISLPRASPVWTLRRSWRRPKKRRRDAPCRTHSGVRSRLK